MRAGLLIQLLLLLLVVKSVTPVAAEQIDYDMELAEIDQQIAEAEAEMAKYSGGLILTMTKMRVELLRSSRALVDFGRIQTLVRSRSEPGVLAAWLASRQLDTDQDVPHSKEVALLCGSYDYYASPVVIRQKDKLISAGGGLWETYSETDDTISYELKNKEAGTIKCQLNRYTLEHSCFVAEDVTKASSSQCKLAGAAKIPDAGSYWLSCSVPGNRNSDSLLKIALGENSTIEGGYVVWTGESDDGLVTERCHINRYSGFVHCTVPGSAGEEAKRSKRWDVLDNPACRVLPRKF